MSNDKETPNHSDATNAWLSEALPEWARAKAMQERAQYLEAVEAWALRQVGYAKGDTVQLVTPPVITDPCSGWFIYKECLTFGAVGEVQDLRYIESRDQWVALFRPDRQWSVVGDNRYKHEGNRRQSFNFPAHWLARKNGRGDDQ